MCPAQGYNVSVDMHGSSGGQSSMGTTKSLSAGLSKPELCKCARCFWHTNASNMSRALSMYFQFVKVSQSLQRAPATPNRLKPQGCFWVVHLHPEQVRIWRQVGEGACPVTVRSLHFTWHQEADGLSGWLEGMCGADGPSFEACPFRYDIR